MKTDQYNLNFEFDAYTPAKIAQRVDDLAKTKAALPFLPLLMLAILAGVFIAFGAIAYTLVVTGSNLGLGPTRLLGGIAFSVGLILVVIGGAELFTGNALMIMALMDHKITLKTLLRNWTVVYIGNFIGAMLMVILVILSGVLEDKSIGLTVSTIAQNKLSLSATEAFSRGILCNILVCLAVWMSLASHRVSGKILAIIFPIAVFVSLGFEHSIANMYVLPVAMIGDFIPVNLSGLIFNLFFVTAGNIIGGGVFVALVYWLIYLHPNK